MRIKRSITLAFLLLMAACGPALVDLDAIVKPKTALKGAIAEFKLSSYDGEHLKGRLLVGATIDPLVIDGRLLEDSDLEMRSLHPCGNKKSVSSYLFDVFFPPLREDQVIRIEPRYWYGINAN